MDYTNLHLPPWGALPAEQYLIRHWDYSPMLSAEQQRIVLVAEYCILEVIPRELYDDPTEPTGFRIPTQNEIAVILRPWRCDDMRKLAWLIQLRFNQYPILIRDHYDASNSHHDRMMQYWMTAAAHGDKLLWAIINDERCFYFARPSDADSQHWITTGYVLPEVVGPHLVRLPGFETIRWKDIPPWCEYQRDVFKVRLYLERGRNPEQWEVDPSPIIESCASCLHSCMCAMVVVLVDKVAFETGRPLLIYADYYTNVIRRRRFVLNRDTLREIVNDRWHLSLTPWMWQESEVGDRYKATGNLAQDLYQLTDADYNYLQ
ncbi:hypothetical protein N7456_002810 [Penicillium angulare]|uniref:Uncharacterized protein n=1 Tax=Penicillium angulare TaxID=116970 RepID=A0A9W9FTI4_9EURO|nr:hypothetical protein N7456_002810 [Penicillium angulare]